MHMEIIIFSIMEETQNPHVWLQTIEKYDLFLLFFFFLFSADISTADLTWQSLIIQKHEHLPLRELRTFFQKVKKK